jgi:hypothetical protein
MPYEISWIRQERVFCIRFSGTITLEEFEAASRAGLGIFLDSAADRVHELIDCTKISRFPTNLTRIYAIFSAKDWQEGRRKVGWVVFFGINSPVMRFVASAVCRMMVIRFRIVATQEDALAFLKEQDETLDLN